MVGFKEVKWVFSFWELVKVGIFFVFSKFLNFMYLENIFNIKVLFCYKGEKYIFFYIILKLVSKVSLYWFNLWGVIIVGNWELKFLFFI